MFFPNVCYPVVHLDPRTLRFSCSCSFYRRAQNFWLKKSQRFVSVRLPLISSPEIDIWKIVLKKNNTLPTEPSKCHGFSPLFRPHIDFLADFIAEIFVNFYDEFFVDFLTDCYLDPSQNDCLFHSYCTCSQNEDKWGYTTSVQVLWLSRSFLTVQDLRLCHEIIRDTRESLYSQVLDENNFQRCHYVHQVALAMCEYSLEVA